MELRWEIPGRGGEVVQLRRPKWTGEDLAGRSLLIGQDQGRGDEIQCARFALWAKARGAEVTLVCHPSLQRLFGGLGVRLWTGRQGLFNHPPVTDLWAWNMDMPGPAGITLENLPNEPYLSVPRAVRLSGKRIGVVTRGNPDQVNDRHRSLPSHEADWLLSLPGTMSLRPEETGARDFAETAALINGLDLVITVDTSVAHLAGAMGKPVWILLPAWKTDWRWMQCRSDTPWYPSAKLYRQSRSRDWGSVLERVEADVRCLLG